MKSGRARIVFLLLGPLLGGVIAFFPWPEWTVAQRHALGITVWTALWWITEPVPIPVTSLLPALLLPLFGIASAKQAAQYYCHHLILLLLAGFFIARAIERWGLHRRIALTVLAWVGGSPRQLVLGFCLAAAFLSMWISNTATTIMLVPIALSVVTRLGEGEVDPRATTRFATCALLAVAYGANVGGVGSLIGTPPNLIFANAVDQLPLDITVDFRTWLVFGAPVVLVFAPLVAILLSRVLLPVPAAIGPAVGREVLREERRRLGRMGPAERRVLVVFALTAGLWVTKGGAGVPGWSALFVWLGAVPEASLNSYVTDSAVALTMAMVLFALPSGEAGGRPLLVWKDVEGVPWGMLLLFGGGFAIAGAFQSTGLSEWIGEALAGALDTPRPVLIAVTAAGVTFLTEVTSNTATTNILMPILASAATEGGLHPLVLMLPAVLSVSFAFMLPVATAPNAIVFATERVPILTMLRVGFVLNLVGVFVVLVVSLLIALPYFGV